ncbi:unknown [Prevotella sp. CAG:5226]|nr:unknown [Prevotella sp. CAG:5226]
MQQAPCKTKQTFSPYKKTTGNIDPFKVASLVFMFESIFFTLTNTKHEKIAQTAKVNRQANY